MLLLFADPLNLSIGTTYDLYWVVYDENIFITTYFANNNKYGHFAARSASQMNPLGNLCSY